MSRIQIFVEGVADQKFFKDLIEEWYGISLKLSTIAKPAGEILNIEGISAFDSPDKLSKISPILQQLKIQEIPVVAILDADTFIENQAFIDVHSRALGFSYFLLPNHGADGDLETLLQEIISPDNQVIFDCWEAYESCLQGKETEATPTGTFTLPARKTKIYAYLEALVGETKSEKEKIKEKERDYRNKKHWNLNPNHPYLQSLKTFLDPFFYVSS